MTGVEKLLKIHEYFIRHSDVEKNVETREVEVVESVKEKKSERTAEDEGKRIVDYLIYCCCHLVDIKESLCLRLVVAQGFRERVFLDEWVWGC